MFFIHMVWDSLQRSGPGEEFDELLARSPHLVDNTLIFQYYNQNTIFQQQAKDKSVSFLLHTYHISYYNLPSSNKCQT